MQLGLSSAAAPGLSIAELADAAARRGLTTLELLAGDPGTPLPHGEAEAAAARRASEQAGVQIVGVLAESARPTEDAARAAAALGAPLLVRPGNAKVPALAKEIARLSSFGARVTLLCGSKPERMSAALAAVEAAPDGVAGLGWEVDPANDDVARLPEVLAAAGRKLEYVRLLGGGPESQQQTGLGVGALMARLALARYRGPLVLTPSTPVYHYIWRAWLGRAGGWGCGSKQQDSSLVNL